MPHATFATRATVRTFCCPRGSRSDYSLRSSPIGIVSHRAMSRGGKRNGIANYEKEVVIGQGNFGVAWKARHKLDGQLYCIKIIPMTAKEDQMATLKEADLLRSLDHPNIIAYKECFLDEDGALCIVTSFCEEGDLANKVKALSKRDELFSENDIMDMFIQIASALLYIHGKKILHRDLKSQNIFIARGGIMVLGDFGISKVLERTDQFAHTVTGTPYYMAPEICSSQPYTFKSDIWSLGILLYELCTLKRAFPADNLLSLIHMIVRGTYPKVEGYSAGLSNLVDTLLTRDPNTRPSLQQVFQMPYVQQHVQRYHKEEKRRARKTANAMTQRRKEREEWEEDVKGGAADLPDFSTLTGPALKDKRREIEAQKRELDRMLATLTMQQTKKTGEDKKAKRETIAAKRAGAQAADPWAVDVLSESTKRRGRANAAMDESMVNIGTMGTMPSTPGYNAYQARESRPVGGSTMAGMGDTVLYGSVAPGAGASRRPGSTNPWGDSTLGATDNVNMGSINYGTTQGGMPYAPPSLVDSFNFGGQGTRPGLPSFRRPAPMSGSGSIPLSPATPQIGGRRDTRQFAETKSTSKTYDRDSNSDYSEYESDFETFDGEDLQEVHQHRMKLLDNMEELERTAASSYTFESGSFGGDRVTSGVKRNKTQALREQCEQILGYHFGDVYLYLRDTRSSGGVQDEEVVHRHLLEMLGKPSDPTVRDRLMQGCFMVDQLVFQESMWSNRR